MVDQRTEFEIALRDNISPGLRSISRQLRQLNRLALEGNTAAAETVERLNKGTVGIGFSARNAVRDITDMTSMMSGFARGLIGVGGTVEAMKAFVTQLNDMARGRVQLASFSKDTRLAAEDIELMRQAMQRMGVDASSADGYISTLTTKLQELRALREGSSLFQELEKMGPKGVGLAKDLLGDVDAGKYRAAVDRVLEFYKKQGERQQFYLSQTMGIPQSVLAELRENIDKSFVSVADEGIAKEWHNNITSLLTGIKNEFDDFSEHVMKRGNELFKVFADPGKASTGFSKWAKEMFDNLDKTLQQDYKDAMTIYNALVIANNAIEDVYNKARPDEAKKAIQERFGRFGVGTGSEDKKLKQEEHSLLNDINDILKRAGEALIPSAAAATPAYAGGPAGADVGTRGGQVPSAIASGTPGGNAAASVAPSPAPVPFMSPNGEPSSSGAPPTSTSPSAPGGPPAPSQGGIGDTSSNFTGDARMSTVGNYRQGSDPRRAAILAAATEASKNLPPGWRVEAFSGERTGAGQGPHGHGAAVDFRLIDPQGRSMGNYQSPQNFAIYEKFAQDSHVAMQKQNPALARQHRWGGYFSGQIGPGGTYGAMDLMHQDFAGGNARMAAGQWETGLQANVARAWGVSEYSSGIDARRAILAKATADQARDRVDSDAGDKWKKGTAAIKFNFNNVPEGVSTNAEADGAFKGNMSVEHKKAITSEAE